MHVFFMVIAFFLGVSIGVYAQSDVVGTYKAQAEGYKRAWEDLREALEQSNHLINQIRNRIIDDLMRMVSLTHVATGEVLHRYEGQCPDETNNYEGRDPQCPACQIIIEAEQAGGWKEHA
jgi:hypothetical protein